MKNILAALCLLMISGVFVFAQDDYKKAELFVGYSNGQVDTGIDSDEIPVGVDIDDRTTFHGVNVSGVYNFSRYVGAKADFSATFNKQEFDFATTTPPSRITFDADSSLYNILGGVQIKDNAPETKVKPFAHALVGAGIAKIKVKNFNCTTTVGGVNCGSVLTDIEDTETGLAGAFGGGLDFRVNNRLDIRAIQFDYNPIRINDQTLHNFRIGVGIVIK